ncbi:hypothetical protein ACFLX4_00275 [Chloroflexota bacterium]
MIKIGSIVPNAVRETVNYTGLKRLAEQYVNLFQDRFHRWDSCYKTKKVD